MVSLDQDEADFEDLPRAESAIAKTFLLELLIPRLCVWNKGCWSRLSKEETDVEAGAELNWGLAKYIWLSYPAEIRERRSSGIMRLFWVLDLGIRGDICIIRKASIESKLVQHVLLRKTWSLYRYIPPTSAFGAVGAGSRIRRKQHHASWLALSTQRAYGARAGLLGDVRG